MTMEKLTLTESQWDGLCNRKGDTKWLPICCGTISRARDILGKIRESNGFFPPSDNPNYPGSMAREFYDNAILHDSIWDAWIGKAKSGVCDWTIREGSPWPEIFRVVRAMRDEEGWVDEPTDSND